MISKELLSEVLKTNKGIADINIDRNYVHYREEEDFIEDGWYAINIYELSHKCKEGAYNKDAKYWFSTWKVKNEYFVNLATIDFKQCSTAFVGNSEPEAIFKACEWILEQKDNQ